MKCYKEGCKAAAPYNTLFRVNQKGITGVWSCAGHVLQHDRELERMVRAIELEERNKRNTPLTSP